MPSAHEIAAFLNRPLISTLPGRAPETAIQAPRPISEAGVGDVTFCGATASDPGGLLARARASLVILEAGLNVNRDTLASNGVEATISVENSRLAFIRTVEHFFCPPRPTGRHPAAEIDPSARIAEDAFVGPGVTIGANVKVGAGTVIHAGAHIYRGVTIGRNVTIHSGAVIGADGFGYERDGQGEFVKFPHLGGVVIEDDVEIGANACIDRGSLGDTSIKTGAKIDNLVHIAHNVVIGRHTAVIADAMVGGSTRVGDHSWVAPSACLRDRIVVGDRAVVGLGSVVTRNVPDGGVVFGAPARDANEHRRLLAAWQVQAHAQESADQGSGKK